MAKNHGAKQQKKLAKQKAKRKEKRTELMKRDSTDPTLRLERAAKWPVVRALVAEELWETGIGYLVIARREGEGRVVFAMFTADVWCLGVKNAHWQAVTTIDFEKLVENLEEKQTLVPIQPECLVKILQGSVAYAQSFGFRPHRDFKHASLLLQGIDPAECPEEYKYGRDGKPFYIQGPFETPSESAAILRRINEVGGDFLLQLPGDSQLVADHGFLDDDDDDDEDFDDEDDSDWHLDSASPPEGLPPPKD